MQVGADKTIVLKTEVNPALVGGLTVQIGDKFMDLSISSKIASMKVRYTLPYVSYSVDRLCRELPNAPQSVLGTPIWMPVPYLPPRHASYLSFIFTFSLRGS